MQIVFGRHRIESAGRKRPAAPQAMERQAQTAAGAVARDRFRGVTRARRLKLAGARQENRQRRLVEADAREQNPHRRPA